MLYTFMFNHNHQNPTHQDEQDEEREAGVRSISPKGVFQKESQKGRGRRPLNSAHTHTCALRCADTPVGYKSLTAHLTPQEHTGSSRGDLDPDSQQRVIYPRIVLRSKLYRKNEVPSLRKKIIFLSFPPNPALKSQ